MQIFGNTTTLPSKIVNDILGPGKITLFTNNWWQFIGTRQDLLIKQYLVEVYWGQERLTCSVATGGSLLGPSKIDLFRSTLWRFTGIRPD